MILILLVFVLLVAVASFQVIQGVYGALIMLLASVISTVVAINYFEPVARMLWPYFGPNAEGAALGGLFMVSLLVLRLLSDRFLRRNVVVGMWANRIGAGVVGLLAGCLVLGIVTIALQLLPLGPSILTYRPFDESLHRRSSLAPFKPDQFTTELIDLISENSLSTDKRLRLIHRDLLLEAFARRNTAGLNGSITAPTDSLQVVGAYTPPYDQTMAWMSEVPPNPLLGEVSTNILIVRAAVAGSAADPDKWWRLPGTHFRLIAKDGRSAYPVGFLYVGDGSWKLAAAPTKDNKVQLTNLAVARQLSGQRLAVDWVFQVDGKFVPHSMAFRMRSWAAVPTALEEMPPSQTALAEVAPTGPVRRSLRPPPS